jgi:hypothetical protein
MGTWDFGPFDNDHAADWSGDLNDAAPADRPALIRAAFTAVLEVGDDYLEGDLADYAVAAAAVVVSLLPGGTRLTTPYAPDFLREGGTVELSDDLPALAVAALDRVVGDESQWRELWSESESFSRALDSVRELREALER